MTFKRTISPIVQWLQMKQWLNHSEWLNDWLSYLKSRDAITSKNWLNLYTNGNIRLWKTRHLIVGIPNLVLRFLIYIGNLSFSIFFHFPFSHIKPINPTWNSIWNVSQRLIRPSPIKTSLEAILTQIFHTTWIWGQK